jgi:hypothetical protein
VIAEGSVSSHVVAVRIPEKRYPAVKASEPLRRPFGAQVRPLLGEQGLAVDQQTNARAEHARRIWQNLEIFGFPRMARLAADDVDVAIRVMRFPAEA